MGDNKLKGISKDDRALWDKAHPEYKEYSDDRQDYLYYSNLVNQFQNNEDYEDLIASVDSAPTYYDANQLLIDYYNNANKVAKKARKEAIKDAIEDEIIPDRESTNTLGYLDDIYNNEDDTSEDTWFGRNISKVAKFLSSSGDPMTNSSSEATTRSIDEELANYTIKNAEKKRELDAIDAYAFANDEEFEENRELVSEIKNIASQVSNVYRDPEIRSKYLNLPDYSSPNENGETSRYNWNELALGYRKVFEKAIDDGDGEQEAFNKANNFLDRHLQNIAYNNQPTWEKYKNGAIQMANSFLSTGLQFAATAAGLEQALSGNWERTEGTNWFEYVMDAIMNNDLAVKANNLVKYGVTDLEKVKDIVDNGGFNVNPIIESWEAEHGGMTDMFSKSFLPTAIAQQGFSIALAVASMGTSAAIEGGLGALKTAQLANKASNLTKLAAKGVTYADEVARISKNINRAGKAASAAAVLATSTTEGFQNGYDTKARILEEGDSFIKELQEQDAATTEERFKDFLDSKNVNEDDLTTQEYNSLYNEFLGIDEAKYKDIEKRVEVEAIKAAALDASLVNLVNGSLNATFGLALQAPAIRNRLRGTKKNGVKITRDAEGIHATPQAQSNWFKKLINAPIVKAAGVPVSEAIEEWSQTAFDDMSNDIAGNSVANYVADKYDYDDSTFETFKGGLSDFAAAWKGFFKGATSDEALKAGVYGAVGSLLGTPSFSRSNYRNPQTGKVSLASREGENIFSYLGRVAPWRSVGADYRMHKAEQKSIENEAKVIEDFFNDAQNAEFFSGIQSIANFERELNLAGEEGDEFKVRNAEISKLVKQAAMLYRTKDSELSKEWVDKVSRLAAIEPESQEAQQYIQEWRDNQTLRQDLEDSEIIDTLKRNASKMNEVIQNVNTAIEQAEDIFPNASFETKEAYAYAKVLLDNQKKRHDSITKELSSITIDSKDSKLSPLSELEKAAIIEFGSRDKAISRLNELDSERKRLEKEIKDLEKQKSQESRAIKERKLRNIKDTLEKYRDLDIQEFSKRKKEDLVLSVSDIMSLSEADKAEMIRNAETNKYSEKQKEAINSIISQGVSQDINYAQKVIDAARLSSSIESLNSQIFSIVKDASKLDSFILANRIYRAQQYFEEEGKSLAKIDDYKTFAAATTRALNKADRATKSILVNTLNASNSENWNKFKASREAIGDVIDWIAKDLSAESGAIKKSEFRDLSTLTAAFGYLSDKGIDILDRQAVYDSLKEVDKDGNPLFLNYITNLNIGKPESQAIFYMPVDLLMNYYDKVIHGYNMDRLAKAALETKANLAEKPVAAKESPKANKPKKPEIKGNKNQQALDEISKAFETASEEVRNAAIELFKNLSTTNGWTSIREQVKDAIISVNGAANIPTLKSMLSFKLREIWGRNKELSRVYNSWAEKYTPKREERVSSEGEKVNLEANNITIYTPATHNYGDFKSLFDSHHVLEYLSENKLGPNTEVFFALSPELAKSDFFKSGIQQDNAPIVILVKDQNIKEDNNPIVIDGEKYQLIGILPALDGKVTGSKSTSILREKTFDGLADLRKDGTPYSLLKNGNNAPITTTLLYIPNVSMTPASGNSQNLISTVANDFGISQEEAVADIKKKLKVKKVGQIKNLVYEGSEGGVTVSPSPISDTTNANGKTLEETINSGYAEQIEQFNFFTKRLVASIAGKKPSVKMGIDSIIKDWIYFNDYKVAVEKGKSGDLVVTLRDNGGNLVAVLIDGLDESDELTKTDGVNMLTGLYRAVGNSLMWQINYDNIDKSWYSSGVVESGVLVPRTNSVRPKSTSPFALDVSNLIRSVEAKPKKAPEVKEKVIANDDNATMQTPAPEAPKQKASGLSADTDSLVSRIKSDSKEIHRVQVNNDKEVYESNGVKRARVTTVISSETKGKIPVISEIIGNAMDNLMKRLTVNRVPISKITLSEEYPIFLATSDKAGVPLQTISDSVKFMDDPATPWEPIVPDSGEEEIKLDGEVRINLKDGRYFNLPIGGAVDMIFTNAKGEFLIVDIKTYRDTLRKETKDHYIKQVSLYAHMLSQKYGIPIDKIHTKLLTFGFSYNPKMNQTVSRGENKYGLNDVNGRNFSVPINPQRTSLEEVKILKDMTFDIEDLPEEVRNQIIEEISSVGGEVTPENIKGAESSIEGEPAEIKDRSDELTPQHTQVLEWLDQLYTDGLLFEQISFDNLSKEIQDELLDCKSPEDCYRVLNCHM